MGKYFGEGFGDDIGEFEDFRVEDIPQIENEDLKIISYNGINVTDSREVAIKIGKRHDHLVRDIDGYVSILNQNPNLGADNFFIESSYSAGTGKNYKCYLLTKQGCEMVANKMTGQKGILFTAEYVQAFNKMEKALQPTDSYMIVDPILRAKAWIHEEEVRQQLQAQNQIMVPKANYYDGLVDSDHLTNIRDTAKELGMKQNKFVSWLITKGYMYRDKKKKLNPYSQYVGDYFELKDKSTSAWSGTQPFVTVEGKKRFRIRLLKENLITA